ncbi:MAG: YdbL family protein [Candidatus Thiodiazotropha sp. (ex Epidulcina cf. delphinae)]|nr:YdbL family protein [Candidatus Thiodiazotropha sp. (ex Epidulcina cf. delphinae)]
MLKRILGYPMMALSLVACVTINIYFPAAAAEEAARTIVRDVLGNEGAPPREQPAQEPVPSRDDRQSAVEKNSFGLTDSLGRFLDFLIPPAHAAEPDIDIDSAAIRGLRRSMAGRQAGLAGHYRSGALGFTNNGFVAVRDLKRIPLRDRTRVKKTVADENGDRKALYSEIARANGHPEWERNIRDTFARVWVEEAPNGYWFQDAGGKWQKK